MTREEEWSRADEALARFGYKPFASELDRRRILEERNATLEARIRTLEADNERLSLDLEAAEELLEDAEEFVLELRGRLSAAEELEA